MNDSTFGVEFHGADGVVDDRRSALVDSSAEGAKKVGLRRRRDVRTAASSATGSTPSAARPGSPPTSKSATRARPCATSATSRSAWDGSWCGTPRAGAFRRRTPTLMPCWGGNIERRGCCRRRERPFERSLPRSGVAQTCLRHVWVAPATRGICACLIAALLSSCAGMRRHTDARCASVPPSAYFRVAQTCLRHVWVAPATRGICACPIVPQLSSCAGMRRHTDARCASVPPSAYFTGSPDVPLARLGRASDKRYLRVSDRGTAFLLCRHAPAHRRCASVPPSGATFTALTLTEGYPSRHGHRG